MRDDLAALRQQLAQLQAVVDQIAHDQRIQFTRIAQLQADLDLVRGAWNQLKTAPDLPYTGPDGGSGSHAKRAERFTVSSRAFAVLRGSGAQQVQNCSSEVTGVSLY